MRPSGGSFVGRISRLNSLSRGETAWEDIMSAPKVCLYVGTIAAALLCSSCADPNLVSLQGSGATFPAPLYKRWFLEYYRAHPDTQVNYQAIGSGAGVRQFTENLTDFGASDAAMNDEEIAKVERGVHLLPMTAGSIVLSHNVPGVDKPLRFSRETYVGIFLDDIKYWDDDAIATNNPGVSLPHLPITVVFRADGSGTTFAFTNHLSAVSKKWVSKLGGEKKSYGKSILWPTGVGARGNSGVTALIQQTPGAIGYLEYGYAELAKLPMAVLENHDGKYIAASPTTGTAALQSAGTNIPDNLRLFIPDPKGEDSYPIVTYTWMLCYHQYPDQRKAEALKRVLRYCLTDGQQTAGKLGYIPLPEAMVAKALAKVESINP
jgi:phosphate transport system substrate-binding protein